MKDNPIQTALAVALMVAATAVGAAAPAVGTADASAIDACGTVSEPGVYELTTNITDTSTSAGACIEVEANDVVIDGNGHRISMEETDGKIRTPIGVRAHGVENVTVRNLTADGWGIDSSLVGTALEFENASDVTVAGVVIPAGPAWDGIAVRNAEDVTVRDVDLTGGGIGQTWPGSGSGVLLEDVDNATVRNGSLQDWERTLTITGSSNVTVENAVIGNESRRTGLDRGVAIGSGVETDTGVRVETSTNVTIRESTITRTYSGVVLGRGTSGFVLADSNVSVNGAAVVVLATGVGGDANVVRNNTVARNNVGVQTAATSNLLRVVGNNVTDNGKGVHVENSEMCGPGPEGGELVEIHGNVLAGNDVGVENDGADAVNAAGNYWGAASGPSSVNDSDAPYGETDPDVPLEDPETGTLADGAGDTVTEFPAPNRSGVSNVRFDPWLEAATGAANETA